MIRPGPIPDGARLLHIGPHKTGSTALQSAFDQSRDEMEQAHVRYGSVGRHDGRAVRWLTDRMLPGMTGRYQPARWDRMKHLLRSEPGWRSVVSSEFFSDARDEHIDRVAAELGVEDTWVAVTLRPLASILPSQYQQTLQGGSAAPYERFLARRLDPGAESEDLHFWLRHRHDALVQRWADRFGADKVVVIALDPDDHGFLPRTFEELLALPSGLLESKPVARNRSLTAGEATVLRQFNERYRAAELSTPFYVNYMERVAATVKERRPASDEQKLLTPDRYIAAANEIGAAMVANIRGSGVRVLGDLEALASVPLRGGSQDDHTEIPIDVGVQFAWACAQAAEYFAADPVKERVVRRFRDQE